MECQPTTIVRRWLSLVPAGKEWRSFKVHLVLERLKSLQESLPICACSIQENRFLWPRRWILLQISLPKLSSICKKSKTRSAEFTQLPEKISSILVSRSYLSGLFYIKCCLTQTSSILIRWKTLPSSLVWSRIFPLNKSLKQLNSKSSSTLDSRTTTKITF